jgi:hypothetical protein
MAINDFFGFKKNLTSPPNDGLSITPDDNTDLTAVIRAINVDTAGTVAVLTTRNTSLTLYVAAGIVFPIMAKRVLATGTTATGIVGLY